MNKLIKLLPFVILIPFLTACPCDENDTDNFVTTSEDNGSETPTEWNPTEHELLYCGNNILDAFEECDEGSEGSVICDKDCSFPTCGDGVINTFVGEECDDSNDNDEDDCSNDCYLPRTVFLTSKPIGSGNFGGINVADTFCQRDAIEHGIKGTFKAWLSDSDSNNDPIVRFGDFSTYKGWYILPTSITPTLVSRGNLHLQVELLAPINVMPNGMIDLESDLVWSNTLANGYAISDFFTCDDWNSNLDRLNGSAGSRWYVNGLWTQWDLTECSDSEVKLYCFQVND